MATEQKAVQSSCLSSDRIRMTSCIIEKEKECSDNTKVFNFMEKLFHLLKLSAEMERAGNLECGRTA
jgi:hypothetical protein